jgi:hypothetical protein
LLRQFPMKSAPEKVSPKAMNISSPLSNSIPRSVPKTS